jgi:hypothetical protein
MEDLLHQLQEQTEQQTLEAAVAVAVEQWPLATLMEATAALVLSSSKSQTRIAQSFHRV